MNKPILFNTEMVQAILDGRKSVTRRVIKYKNNQDPSCTIDRFLGDSDPQILVSCSPYQVGDVLWVRETWEKWDNNLENDYIYKVANKEFLNVCKAVFLKWKPSIHMPKEAARIFLNVTDVRVERLQDITDEQAKAEGCIGLDPYTYQNLNYYDKVSPDNYWTATFAGLWDSTLPKNKNKFKGKENTWKDNPWVWVIEFKRCEKPINFMESETTKIKEVANV